MCCAFCCFLPPTSTSECVLFPALHPPSPVSPSPSQYVVLDSSSIHDLDSSSLKTLEGLVALLVDRDPPIEMFLAPVSDPLMVQVRKQDCDERKTRYSDSAETAILTPPVTAPYTKTKFFTANRGRDAPEDPASRTYV